MHNSHLIPRRVAILSATILVLLFETTLKAQELIHRGETSTTTPDNNKSHIAFAGGGWRAHSAHAGWVIAALNESDNKLARAFTNIGAISSNSGGSWFNTMLAYSDEFVEAIESPEAFQNWARADKAATGWLGQQEYVFNQAP